MEKVFLLFMVILLGCVVLSQCSASGIDIGIGTGQSGFTGDSSRDDTNNVQPLDVPIINEIKDKFFFYDSEPPEPPPPPSTEPPTAPDKEVVFITVSGRGYIFGNRVKDLESLLSEMNLYERDTEIRVYYDNTATKNATDDLTYNLQLYGFTNIIYE